MVINKRSIALFWGLLILMFHVGLSFYLWFLFAPSVDSRIAIAEISVPLTVTYAVTVAKYFVDTQAQTAGGELVPWTYLLFTAITVVPFLVFLGGLPVAYKNGYVDFEALNPSYAFGEAALGAVFVIVFNDLFKTPAAPPT